MSKTKDAYIEVIDAMDAQTPSLKGDDVDDSTRLFQLCLIVSSKAKNAGQSVEEYIAA